jgi:hypothetical protein
MHIRQTRTPSSGLSMRTKRWHRGHVGRTIPATPAACSRQQHGEPEASQHPRVIPAQDGPRKHCPRHRTAITSDRHNPRSQP